MFRKKLHRQIFLKEIQLSQCNSRNPLQRQSLYNKFSDFKKKSFPLPASKQVLFSLTTLLGKLNLNFKTGKSKQHKK